MKRSHRLATILATISVLLAASATARAATIAHWDFEEGTPGNVAAGAGSVLDISGNGHHGTPLGDPTYVDEGGDTALDFDGAGDRVFVSDSAAFSLSSLTVEASVELDSVAPGSLGLDQLVFYGDSRAGLDPFYLGILGGRLTFFIQGSSTALTRLVSPDLLPLGELLHVAGTLDDTTGAMRLFINGAEVASQTTAIRPSTLALSAVFNPGIGLGNLQDGGNQFMDGRMLEARISDVALAPSQLLGATAPVPEPGTLALLVAAAAGLPLVRRREQRAR